MQVPKKGPWVEKDICDAIKAVLDIARDRFGVNVFEKNTVMLAAEMWLDITFKEAFLDLLLQGKIEVVASTSGRPVPAAMREVRLVAGRT